MEFIVYKLMYKKTYFIYDRNGYKSNH